MRRSHGMTEEEWDDYQRDEFDERMERLRQKYEDEDDAPDFLTHGEMGIPPPGTRLKMGGW